MIQIKNIYTKDVIFESKTSETIKEAVEEAVNKGISLSRADLTGANLFKVNLSEANLSRANLSRANLSRANLFKVNLVGADLTGASLYFIKMDKEVFKFITEKWFEWEVRK